MIRPTALALLLLVSCGGSPAGAGVDLTGAGATFPYPLYSKWFDEYQRVAPGVRINYQSIGSGGGIRQLIVGTVDFGASDVPLKPSEQTQAGRPVVQIPTTIGAVVVAYHLPELRAALRLDGPTLAAIYLGEITRWDDPRLRALNPGAPLPDRPITVTHRTDGSGTTAVFTGYLAAVSPAWARRVGAGKSVRWPVGLGAKGNEGVAGLVLNIPYTIGYAESAYVKQTRLAFAALRNRAGRFVTPTPEASTAAASGARALTDPITDAAAPAAYPLASFTYILLYREQDDAAKGVALVRFLSWASRDGQRFAAALGYAPLPAAVVAAVERALRTITAGGRTLLEES